jgi:hypothetical protein
MLEDLRDNWEKLSPSYGRLSRWQEPLGPGRLEHNSQFVRSGAWFEV